MKKWILIGSLVFMFIFEALAGGSDEELLRPIAVKSKDSQLCKILRKKMHTVVSKIASPDQTLNYTYELDKYYLTADSTEGTEDTFNHLDIDGDGAFDTIQKSCSASLLLPSDPCLLTVKLSTGNEFDFQGWDIRVIKYKSKFYLKAHHDDEARSKLFTQSSKKDGSIIYHPEVAASIKYQVYLINSAGIKHICTDL